MDVFGTHDKGGWMAEAQCEGASLSCWSHFSKRPGMDMSVLDLSVAKCVIYASCAGYRETEAGPELSGSAMDANTL